MMNYFSKFCEKIKKLKTVFLVILLLPIQLYVLFYILAAFCDNKDLYEMTREAKIECRQGNYNKAIIKNYLALKLDLSRLCEPEALSNLAECYYYKGDYKTAEFYILKFVKECTSVDIRGKVYKTEDYSLAKFYYKTKNFNKSREHFEKILESPEYPPKIREEAEKCIESIDIYNNVNIDFDYDELLDD